MNINNFNFISRQGQKNDSCIRYRSMSLLYTLIKKKSGMKMSMIHHNVRDGCRTRHTILGNVCWHRCTRVLCGRDNNIILLFFIILSLLILFPPQLFISSLPRPGEIL